MKILIHFNNGLTNKQKNIMGGVETLNYNLINHLKKKHKIFTAYNRDKPSLFDLIISSNDAEIFDKFKSNKKILWLHNKLQIEKAIRKKQGRKLHSFFSRTRSIRKKIIKAGQS